MSKVLFYRAQIGMLTLTEKVVVPVTYEQDIWRDVEVEAGKYPIYGHFTWSEDVGLLLISAYAPAEGITVGGSMYSMKDTESCVGEPWTASIKIATQGYMSSAEKLMKGVVLHPGVCAYESGDEDPTKSLKMWHLAVDHDNFKLVVTSKEAESDGHFEAKLTPVKKKGKGDIKVKYTSAGHSTPATREEKTATVANDNTAELVAEG